MQRPPMADTRIEHLPLYSMPLAKESHMASLQLKGVGRVTLPLLEESTESHDKKKKKNEMKKGA